MVVVGFSHEGGSFTAKHSGLPDRDLREHELEAPVPGSYEHYLSTASFPRLVLDLRGRDPNAPGSSWLAGSRLFRHIGAVYDPEFADPILAPVLAAHGPLRSGSM